MPRSNNCISGGRRKFSLFDRFDPGGNLTPLWHRGGAYVVLSVRHKWDIIGYRRSVNVAYGNVRVCLGKAGPVMWGVGCFHA